MTQPGGPFFIGLISGTSMDGIDAALLRIPAGEKPEIIATQGSTYQPELRNALAELCLNKATPPSHLGGINIQVGQAFARAALDLLSRTQLQASDITAIGSHGQTIWHEPGTSFPFTTQLGDPSTIAHITGITTVADFRSRDMAAGGQGAPLAPLFHQHCFYRQNANAAIVNIGGIANLTTLSIQEKGCPLGYDTGPGNVLMDCWIQHCLGRRYDDQGSWAQQGQIIPALLSEMLQEPYLALPAPKSTGRELFNLAWIETALLASIGTKPSDTQQQADVQRTLLELTAESISQAFRLHTTNQAPLHHSQLAVCGGGAHNPVLMDRMRVLLPGVQVSSTHEFGIDPDWVEAATFAWLASETLQGRRFDNQLLTGANGEITLGGIYPA